MLTSCGSSGKSARRIAMSDNDASPTSFTTDYDE
jgi:hypothetical protein